MKFLSDSKANQIFLILILAILYIHFFPVADKISAVTIDIHLSSVKETDREFMEK